MALAAPINQMAKLYRDHLPADERLAQAAQWAEDPAPLIEAFTSSVQETAAYYARSATRQPERFYASDRGEAGAKPGLGNTAEVGALMERYAKKPWPVLGDDSLSFRYVDRELLLTQSSAKSEADDEDQIGLRIDLLLANLHTMRPIVGELKVTGVRGNPDKDPFSALIQALAAATYLLPAPQLARLHQHDRRHSRAQLVDTGDGKLDVYVITVREPPASTVWFELRDAAERLASKVAPELKNWLGTVAFLELGWLPYPEHANREAGAMRPPRVTKRFAVSG